MTLYALDGIRPTIPDTGDCWIAPDANIIGRVDFAGWIVSLVRRDASRRQRANHDR